MVNLLSKMGTIEIRKFSIEPKIGEDGELIFHAPIDWDKTLRLWYEDEEAHKNKTLIKVENREVFKRFYNKLRANYKNKSFYDFLLNKNIKTNINKKAKK